MSIVIASVRVLEQTKECYDNEIFFQYITHVISVTRTIHYRPMWTVLQSLGDNYIVCRYVTWIFTNWKVMKTTLINMT